MNTEEPQGQASHTGECPSPYPLGMPHPRMPHPQIETPEDEIARLKDENYRMRTALMLSGSRLHEAGNLIELAAAAAMLAERAKTNG